MDKHTPGPWVKEPFGTTFVIRGPQRQIVCGTVEAENADLLISVPEMLDALRKVIEFDAKHAPVLMSLPFFKDMHASVFETVAKATRRDGPVLREGV